MGTVIKRILIVIVALVILLAIALGAITALFNPNDYKDDIEKIALEKAGIDLDIKGDISWSVFPTLGFSIESLDARFEGQPDLGTLNSASLSLNLPALLSGNVEMNKIEIDGLDLSLIKNANGQGNWEQIPSTNTSAEPSATPETSSDSPENGDQGTENKAVSFNIESIALVNSHLLYRDESNGQSIELKDLNIQSGEIQQDTPFPVSLTANLIQSQGDQVVQTVDIDAATDLTLNMNDQQYQASDLKANLTVHADKLIKFALESDVTANLAEGKVAVDNINAGITNVKLNGHITVNGLNSDATQVEGQLNTNSFAVNSVLEELGLPIYAATDSSALNKVQLSTSIAGNLNTIRAENISVQVDDTTLTGNAGYRLSDGRISAKLSGNHINLDRYLPPETDSAGQAKAVTSGESGTSKANNNALPLDTLRGLNLSVALAFNEITAKAISMKQLDTQLNASGGVIKLEKANVKALGGAINSNATLNVTGNMPKLSVNKTIQGLQLGELLTQLNGSAPLTGALATKASITASGISQEAIMNSLNGTIDLTLTDGVIQGIDMAQQMCQTINNVSALGKLTTAATVDGSTPFAKMTGHFNVKNGVISNNDLSVDLDAMNVSGKGTASLPASSLDYRLGLVIQDNLFNKTCSINNKLEGVTWPVRCKGSFDTAPAELCKPDVEAMQDMVEKALKEKAKEEVKSKVKEKVEDKIKDKLGDDEAVKGLLDKLF
jgi:AsmA protein